MAGEVKPPTKMQLAMIPIMVMINKLDLPADSDRVMYVRFAFWSMVALNILVYLGIWLLIGRTTDNTEIYAKPPKGKSMVADESGAVYQKTTYQETEKSLCSNKFFETILGACISTAISSYFKIPSAMIMQLFYIPANTWDCPLFKCYIRHAIVDKKKDRPYGEKYEGEDMRAAKIIKEEKEAKQKEEAEQSELFDTAMTKVWEDSSTETAEEQEENYQNLLDVVDDVPLGIDHCLKGEERTLLMQVVGTHLKTTLSMLDTLLSKKPNITLIDEDGWTAIHWASFHGNSEALSRLLAYNVEVRKHLLMCYQSKLTCS